MVDVCRRRTLAYSVTPVPTDVTKGGFRHFLSNYRNADGQTSVFSGVGSVSARVTDRLRVDLGARYEYNDFVQRVENTADVDLELRLLPATGMTRLPRC